MRYLKKDLNIQVADNVAEEIKLQIGSVSRLGMHGDMLVRGVIRLRACRLHCA